MKRSVMAILTATVILLSFLGSALFQGVHAVDPTDWYTTVNGVLDSDYYVLYPFSAKSLKVGFSKYGELIGIPAGADQGVQANWVGLEYDGRDPFCPPDTIPMTSWINGWYIDIQYIDPALSGAKRDRHLWALAMFADGFGWGGDWVSVKLPGDEPHGGRKTNGTCVTDPLQILYNGPRRFVAMSVTHIYDKDGTTTWPVVDVTITMIFNKVKKEVVLLKDIKLKIPKMHLWEKLDVEFSNREEYDLGPSPGYASYAHFYEQNGTTCYGPDWHMAKDLLRENVTHFTGDGSNKTFTIPTTTLAEGFIKIWINGVFQDPSKYTVSWAAKTVTFAVPPPLGSDVEVHYKYVYKTATYWDHEYDIAQMISSDLKYVAWTAMWPPVSDYTVDGILRFLDPLLMVNEADMSIEPKQSPLIIGEWDFLMDHEKIPQFRCVEVKGVTDRHDATDSPPKIDIEVYYQLDEVFMPWDLESAVYKDTKRWVDFYTVTATDVSNAAAGVPLEIDLTYSPVLKASVWEKYCSFSERVLWGGALKIPIRSVYTTYHYELYVLADGTGYISIPATKVPAAGTVIKILYSTYTSYSNWDDIDKTWTDEIAYAASVDIFKGYTYTIIDPLKANHTLYIRQLNFTVSNLTAIPANHTYNFIGTMDFYEEDFKVFKEDRTMINCYWWDQSGPHGGRSFRHNESDGTINVDFWGFRMQWYITPPAGEDLHVDWLHLDVDYNITVFYNATSQNYTITTNFNINGKGGIGLFGTKGTWTDQLYVEHIPGRYEWITVGNHSRAIDSAGAAMVSAAFKNKQIEIGLSGLDVQDIAWGANVPYLLSNMTYRGTGRHPAIGYYDSIGRLALKDDWCKTWPIASSNIIALGGPSANIISEYFNEFTDAFIFSTLGSGILPLPCWNKTFYPGAGYAIISTYKDINGTVGLVIWGWTGDDTYYAAKWFHEEGIYQLQEFPSCVTTIILKIDYTTHPPTVTVKECLGTISETLVHKVKGGIHDP